MNTAAAQSAAVRHKTHWMTPTIVYDSQSGIGSLVSSSVTMKLFVVGPLNFAKPRAAVFYRSISPNTMSNDEMIAGTSATNAPRQISDIVERLQKLLLRIRTRRGIAVPSPTTMNPI